MWCAVLKKWTHLQWLYFMFDGSSHFEKVDFIPCVPRCPIILSLYLWVVFPSRGAISLEQLTGILSSSVKSQETWCIMHGSIWLQLPSQPLLHALVAPACFNTFNGTFWRFSLGLARVFWQLGELWDSAAWFWNPQRNPDKMSDQALIQTPSILVMSLPESSWQVRVERLRDIFTKHPQLRL